MALYANENGTLQQLSDKSSGNNPYGQLEVLYSRDFVDDPLVFDDASTSITHTIESNKPLSEYHNMIHICGTPSNTSPPNFQSFGAALMYIPLQSTYKRYSSIIANTQFRITLATYAFMHFYLPADINSNLIKFKYASSTSSVFTLDQICLDIYLI